MAANDLEKLKSSSRERLRGRVFWPAICVLAAVAVAAIFFRRPAPSAAGVQESKTAVAGGKAMPNPLVAAAPARREAARQNGPEMEPETARLRSLMFDPSQSQQARRQAARALAKIGSDEAMSALRAALAAGDVPPYVKAAIAEGLGQSPNPAATELLHELLSGKDETVARAAERGLALRGDDDAVATLGNTLFNDQTPLSVRTEAALALGDVNSPGAQDLLTRAISQIQDEDVRESILDGLGRRPFSETQEFFRNYLDSPNVSADSKVLAIQAITDAEGDVGPFLKNYANDPNPDVRAAVKQALDFINW